MDGMSLPAYRIGYPGPHGVTFNYDILVLNFGRPATDSFLLRNLKGSMVAMFSQPLVCLGNVDSDSGVIFMLT